MHCLMEFNEFVTFFISYITGEGNNDDDTQEYSYILIIF